MRGTSAASVYGYVTSLSEDTDEMPVGVHKGNDGSWVCSELSTGWRLATGPTRASALLTATSRLARCFTAPNSVFDVERVRASIASQAPTKKSLNPSLSTFATS